MNDRSSGAIDPGAGPDGHATTIRPLESSCTGRGSVSSPRKSAQSLMDIAETSAIDFPIIVTARTIGFNRVPAQVGQCTSRM